MQAYRGDEWCKKGAIAQGNEGKEDSRRQNRSKYDLDTCPASVPWRIRRLKGSDSFFLNQTGCPIGPLSVPADVILVSAFAHDRDIRSRPRNGICMCSACIYTYVRDSSNVDKYRTFSNFQQPREYIGREGIHSSRVNKGSLGRCFI